MRMPLIFCCALLAAPLACTRPWMNPQRDGSRTEVVVFPVVEDGPKRINVEALAAMIAAARPDAIVALDPEPADDDGVEVAEEVIQRVRLSLGDHLPLLTLSQAVRLPAVDASVWEHARRDASYRQVRQHRVRRDASEDQVDWFLSPARARLIDWEHAALRGALATASAAVRSNPVNSRKRSFFHAVSCKESGSAASLTRALNAHSRQRLAVVVPSRHALCLERAAAAVDAVRVVDPRAFWELLSAATG